MKKKIHNKFNYYTGKMENDLYKPEMKFLKESILGIIKSKTIILRQIALELYEDIKLENTVKRLRNHLNKDYMFEKLTQSHIESVKNRINNRDYLILDKTDINKDNAKELERLDKVRDGDKEKFVKGYWNLNLLRVSRNDNELTPLYSKLYSHVKETRSDNTEILNAFDMVDEYSDKDLIKVIDRAGDSRRIIEPFIRNDDKFIIRLNKRANPRHLYHNGSAKSFVEISKQLDLNTKLVTEKKKDGKLKKEHFKGGATRVKFINKDTHEPYDKDLWLVTMKRSKGGYSYFLLNVDLESSEEVVRECFQGYGLRWKIEEYHRHIKQEYNLEDIQLINFNNLQTMVTLLMISMYLVYTELSRISFHLLCREGPYESDDLEDFIYYKLGRQVAKILSTVTLRRMVYHKGKQRNSRQLRLDLSPS